MAPHSFPNKPGGQHKEPRFNNPMVADGINTPDRRHVRSLFVNLAIIGGALFILLFLLDWGASSIAPYIPFQWEKDLAGGDVFPAHLSDEGLKKRDELRRLAGRVAENMDLPAGMSISAHYAPDPTMNAFATLGGNIVVFQGLLDKLGSEDELAMILAHEIAHVKHRDIVRGVVRAASIGLIMMGIQDSGGFTGQAARLGLAGYSRAQEEAADAEAVKTLGRMYGHAVGADRFFRTLAFAVEKKTSSSIFFPDIFASHPDSSKRVARVEIIAKANDIAMKGRLTPLPDVFSGVMQENGGREYTGNRFVELEQHFLNDSVNM